MIDQTTKILLAVIGAGLWANAAITTFKVAPAKADNSDYFLRSIDSNIGAIARGTCVNGKLC